MRKAQEAEEARRRWIKRGVVTLWSDASTRDERSTIAVVRAHDLRTMDVGRVAATTNWMAEVEGLRRAVLVAESALWAAGVKGVLVRFDAMGADKHITLRTDLIELQQKPRDWNLAHRAAKAAQEAERGRR